MIDAITVLVLILGGGFVFVAGLGIFRMRDTIIRMHASTKAGTLGIGLILISVMLNFQDFAISARAFATILFLLLTAPVAAHLMGRAAVRSGVPLHPRTQRVAEIPPAETDSQSAPEPPAHENNHA